MDYRYVNFESDGGVARMTLNRPDAGNALHIDMCKEMMDVSIRCDEDPGVRVLVVDAAGRMFCAGGDLRSFADQADRLGPVLKEMTGCTARSRASPGCALPSSLPSTESPRAAGSGSRCARTT